MSWLTALKPLKGITRALTPPKELRLLAVSVIPWDNLAKDLARPLVANGLSQVYADALAQDAIDWLKSRMD